MSSEQLVGAGGELAVAVRDAAGGMRRPADRDAAIADRDVGMVVLGLREVGEPADEVDRLAEPVELHRPLEGVVAYCDADGRARGVLLWDVWGKVDAARELIRAAEPVGADALQELLA